MENMFAQGFDEREVDRNKYYAGCTTYTTAARDAHTALTDSGRKSKTSGDAGDEGGVSIGGSEIRRPGARGVSYWRLRNEPLFYLTK